MTAPRALIFSAAAIPALLTHQRPVRSIRQALARGLESTGQLLTRAAVVVAPERMGPTRAQPVPTDVPSIEFYADASAPEGALYVNGAFVGRLPLTRL